MKTSWLSPQGGQESLIATLGSLDKSSQPVLVLGDAIALCDSTGYINNSRVQDGDSLGYIVKVKTASKQPASVSHMRRDFHFVPRKCLTGASLLPIKQQPLHMPAVVMSPDASSAVLQ